MEWDMSTDALDDSIKVGSASRAAKPIRKKFAVPPVKLACLECRASRTRCDGKTECSNCTNRGKTCIYTQSKRGGSRIRRKRVPSESGERSPSINNNELNQCALSIMPELEEGTFAAPLSLVTPGGGLKQLDFSLDDTDFIFDSIFATQPDSLDSGYETSEHAGTLSDAEQREIPIRVYSSDEEILSAYYTYIHPYFPVLPPPEPGQVTDSPDYGIRRTPDAIFSSKSVPNFEPSTPISLAISASLALIPHPDDKNPSAVESLQLRREQAQAFAQSAFESIEIESELVDSVIQPGEALSSEPVPLNRKPFHPRVPLENESIIALILLSTYEYAQRGNIAKMRNRAGQAVNAAINLGLHIKGDEENYYSEANRRVWWMAYITVCQGAILSNSTPPILLYDPRFTTTGPTFAGDPGAWSVFLQSQQAITSATQFVIDLDATMKQGSNTTAIWDRMLELETIIEPLILAADTWTLSSTPPLSLEPSEMVVGQALRGIARIKLNSARIKLHRFCAFSDVPVFSKKHCDLAPIPASTHSTPSLSSAGTSNLSTPTPSAPNCSCSSTFQSLPSLSDMTTSHHIHMHAQNQNQIQNQFNPSLLSASSLGLGLGLSNNILPYSTHYSAKICLKSAFAIARSFAALPYPQPFRQTPAPTPTSASTNPYAYYPHQQVSPTPPPRMIPVFACCAMQASYALIMLSYKTKAMGFANSLPLPSTEHANINVNGTGKESLSPAQKLLGQLSEGLQMILGALKNYSVAYEALGGMRDQIDIAAQSVGAAAEVVRDVRW